MDHQIAPLLGLSKCIGLSPPFRADLSLTWEDFLQLSVKSIWVGEIEFLLFWRSCSKQSCWVGRQVQENNNFKSWFEHFSKEPQWGYDEALWSIPCCYKLWGDEKKKTTEHVQVLFLLGFGKTCWGANNKTQTVHRLGFDITTVSISLKG